MKIKKSIIFFIFFLTNIFLCISGYALGDMFIDNLYNNLLYNYDYNRYFQGRNDNVLNIGIGTNSKQLAFKNKVTQKQYLENVSGVIFKLEAVQRKNTYSYFESADYSVKETANNSNTMKIDSVVLRFGIQKDLYKMLWIFPITLHLGGGVSSRVDWVEKDVSNYNTVIYAGINGKIGLSYHWFVKSGKTSMFIQYQPDFYVVTNSRSAKGLFSVKPANFQLNHTVSTGISLNLRTLK